MIMRAAANAVGKATRTKMVLPPQLQAEIAVAAEEASDSIMYDCAGTTLLFEHRTGLVRKTLGGPLPRMVILGFDTGTGAVDTNGMTRARYTPQQIAAFAVAATTLERAIQKSSVDLVGRVATFSAKVNQSYLPKPNFDALLEIKDMVGSAGVVVAHSGVVAGLIFDPGLADLAARLTEARALLKELGFHHFHTFTTPY